MVEPSNIAQLHTITCLIFVTTTMPSLNPKLLQCSSTKRVVVGTGNVTPLTLGFAKLSIPEEWKDDYQPIQSKYQPSEAQQLIVHKNMSRNQVFRIGRSQRSHMPDLERQMSSLSTSSSTSVSNAPVYKPISG